MASAHTPRNNHLLANLPTEASARLFPDLEMVQLTLGEVLYESGSSGFGYRLTGQLLKRVQ